MDLPRLNGRSGTIVLIFKANTGPISMQLCVRFMRESIVVDTVCEFAQVGVFLLV